MIGTDQPQSQSSLCQDDCCCVSSLPVVAEVLSGLPLLLVASPRVHKHVEGAPGGRHEATVVNQGVQQRAIRGKAHTNVFVLQVPEAGTSRL